MEPGSVKPAAGGPGGRVREVEEEGAGEAGVGLAAAVREEVEGETVEAELWPVARAEVHTAAQAEVQTAAQAVVRTAAQAQAQTAAAAEVQTAAHAVLCTAAQAERKGLEAELRAASEVEVATAVLPWRRVMAAAREGAVAAVKGQAAGEVPPPWGQGLGRRRPGSGRDAAAGFPSGVAGTLRPGGKGSHCSCPAPDPAA